MWLIVCHFPIRMWCHSFLRHFISNVIHCEECVICMSLSTSYVKSLIRMSLHFWCDSSWRMRHLYVTCDWFVCHFPIHMWRHSFLRHFISNVIHREECVICMSHVTDFILTSTSYVMSLILTSLHIECDSSWHQNESRHIWVWKCPKNESFLCHMWLIFMSVSNSYVTWRIRMSLHTWWNAF